MMKSSVHGINTLPVEITNISTHGIWLFAHGKEYFMSYSDFPWFENQTIKSIIKVEEQSPNHFYWSDIDVDLTLKMFEHPEHYPLKAKHTTRNQPVPDTSGKAVKSPEGSG